MKQQKLFIWMRLTAAFSVLIAFPAHADVVMTAVQPKQQAKKVEVLITDIPRLNDIPRQNTSIKDWLAQENRQNQVLQVTGVRLFQTKSGLEVILETSTSNQLQTTINREGNTFTAVISNAQLRSPSGNTLRSDNPTPGITAVTVTNQDANNIQVTVTGLKGVPTVELFDSDQGLIFSVTTAASSTQQPQKPQTQQSSSQTPHLLPSASGEEPIELVVTGELEGSYSVPSASTATKIELPLRDIPQSIQVIPRQVIEDRKILRLSDLANNVSGVQLSTLR